MKKAFFVFLFVFCVLAIAVAAAEFDPVYVSDFADDEDGWQGTPGYFELTHTKEGSLMASLTPEAKKKIKSSKPEEIGLIGLKLNNTGLSAGAEYRFSIEIFQNQAKEVSFEFLYSNQDLGVYQSATEIVKKGEWTSLSFSAFVDEGYSLLQVMNNPPYIDYEIRNVKIEPDRKTFIQGIEYDIDTNTSDSTLPEFLKLKAGDVLSDEFLDIQVRYVREYDEKYHGLKLHIVPHQTGITELGGVYWVILPREELPEEMLGTWEITEEDKSKMYYTFHPDGRAFYFWKPSSGRSASQKMLQYAYSQGKIMFSRAWGDEIDRMDIEDSILMPHSLAPQRFHMKGKPKHIAAGKVSLIQSCSIRFYDNIRFPNTVFVDSSPDASPYMALPIEIEIKPDSPIDPSIAFHFSNPEVAEVSDYSGWTLHIRGKKPGTTELTVQPDHKNGKASNTISITVLEGEKTLPDELVGVRWVGDNPLEPGSKMCIIFDRNGRYTYLEKREYMDSLIVYAGFYLYRDGVIQIGSGDEENDLMPFFSWLYVEESDGQKVLKDSLIYLTSEPLSTENEHFPSNITPAIDSSTGWNEFWTFCRYCWNHQLSLPQT